VTKIKYLILKNLVTPKARAKHEPLVQQTGLWLLIQRCENFYSRNLQIFANAEELMIHSKDKKLDHFSMVKTQCLTYLWKLKSGCFFHRLRYKLDQMTQSFLKDCGNF
jgi:hypothetical protein